MTNPHIEGIRELLKAGQNWSKSLENVSQIPSNNLDRETVSFMLRMLKIQMDANNAITTAYIELLEKIN